MNNALSLEDICASICEHYSQLERDYPYPQEEALYAELEDAFSNLPEIN